MVTAHIRPLRASEWSLWRALRLRAVAESPDAFRGTFADESKRSDAWWRDMIEPTVAHPRGGLWLAEARGEAVGMVFGRLSEDLLTVGIGAMWVDPDHRGEGLGLRLVDTVVTWGREAGAVVAELWVTEDNSAAEILYRSAGFEPTDTTEALREGSLLTVRLMRFDLTSDV